MCTLGTARESLESLWLFLFSFFTLALWIFLFRSPHSWYACTAFTAKRRPIFFPVIIQKKGQGKGACAPIHHPESYPVFMTRVRISLFLLVWVFLFCDFMSPHATIWQVGLWSRKRERKKKSSSLPFFLFWDVAQSSPCCSCTLI